MEQFFVTGALPSGSITLDQLFSYNLLLVLVSFLLASFGSYVAIWVLRISIDSSDALKKIGVLIGAVVMATAIWSMHYTGMLSYNMTMVHTYDPLLTAFSGLLAFLFSYAVFYFLIMHQMTSRIILVSAPLLGLGVATMHYSGMEAMQMDARLLYKPDLFALSLVIAVTASAAALWMMNGITQLTKHRHTAQIVAACIMGIAVCGMHYAGMAASVFIPFADCRFDFNQSFVDFSLAVSTMAFLVMGIAIAFLYYALQFKKKGSLTNEFVMLARFLYGTLSLVAVVITVTALMTYDIHLTLKDLSKNEAEDTKLHTEIVYLSKFLTMSATMAAKTGEPEWEVQYDSHAAQLQKKIKLAIERHPVKYSELGIGKADEAYGELTKIKKQVFAFVKSGQLEQAVLLMESDNHARYKRQYLDGIQSFSKVISQLAEGQIKQINQQSNLLLFIVFPGLVALMVGFFALLHGRKFVKHTLFERHFNQKILDAIADPVFVKGDNHEWKRGNRAFGKLIGGDQDDYVDTHYSDFFVSETQEELWQREDGVIDLGTTDINEEQIRLPNDDFIDAVVTRSPLTLSDGSRGLVGIVHDITHLKKVEVELGEHKDNLERLVEVQTKSLQAALEEAKQVSELKSDFLSNMSHELRTPLNSIIGMSSLMLEEPLNSGQEEMMSTLETSSKNLLEIVNDILDLSKIESGALELEHIAFDAQQTISNVIDMLAPMASQKDVNLYWHGKGLAPIFVMGDPLRYARIVTNLVSNAVKYTDAGQVDVSLDTTQLDGGGRMLKLIIKDTGIGMNAEAVERVFDKFTQADTSTTRRYGGSGLGLAITKQLVDKMQGKITIESAPGLGSEFAVACLHFLMSSAKRINQRYLRVNNL